MLLLFFIIGIYLLLLNLLVSFIYTLVTQYSVCAVDLAYQTAHHGYCILLSFSDYMVKTLVGALESVGWCVYAVSWLSAVDVNTQLILTNFLTLSIFLPNYCQ